MRRGAGTDRIVPLGHPPSEFIDVLHQAGCRVWEQVGSVDAARCAVDGGVDLIVAQGSKAGGHNLGSLPSMALVPLIVDPVAPTPVLAAGGVADGRGVCCSPRSRATTSLD